MTSSVLFQSFGLHIGGLFFLTIVLVLFIRRKKDEEKSSTRGLFASLIYITYLINISQILAFVFEYLEEIKGISGCHIWAVIFARVFTISAMLFAAAFQCYFIKKMILKDNNPKRDKLLYGITIGIAVILFIMSLFFSVKFHTNSEKYVLNGTFSIFTYTEFGLASAVLLFSLLKNIKFISFNEILILTYIAVGYIIIVLLEKLGNYDISEVPYILSIYIFTIYFTMENTSVLKTNKLKEEQQNLLEIEKKTSITTNENSQEIIGNLNNEYIDANILLNSKNLTDEQFNKYIDEIIENNNSILNAITSKKEGN